jgi:tryptophan synthase alpha subunit
MPAEVTDPPLAQAAGVPAATSDAVVMGTKEVEIGNDGQKAEEKARKSLLRRVQQTEELLKREPPPKQPPA